MRVGVGGTTERNVRLPLSTIKESITVKGDAPLIDPADRDWTDVVDRQRREPAEQALYRRGQLHDRPAGSDGRQHGLGLSVNVMGSTGAETPLMVDGVVTNHPASGGGWTHFDLDAIGEVSATTLGASPEFQGAAGGVLNVITKAGTNQFRRDAAGVLRPAVAVEPADRSSPATVLTVRPASLGTNRDVSAHLGGPIRRNRAWFYGGISSLDSRHRRRASAAPAAGSALVWFADPSAKVAVKLSDHVNLQQTYL